MAGDPLSTEESYAAAKRGGELASLRHEGPVLLARAGLIVGPHENVGRLPFWLGRIARGGRVPAPGPADLPIQLIDARDLARWIRHCALAGTVGAFNVTSPPGFVTIGDVLAACLAVTGSQADLVWLSADDIAAAGVEPWTGMPLWLPAEHEAFGLLDADVSAALAAGLAVRPVLETVRDTWAWIQAGGMPSGTSRGGQGYDDAAALRLLAQCPGHGETH